MITADKSTGSISDYPLEHKLFKEMVIVRGSNLVPFTASEGKSQDLKAEIEHQSVRASGSDTGVTSGSKSAHTVTEQIIRGML